MRARRQSFSDSKSEIEELFAGQLRLLRLPAPEREYRFHDVRRWRFDFAWPVYRLAAEVEGGTWVNGRHNRPEGFEKDCEKYNTAALAGLQTTIDSASAITDGLARGRARLGG